MKLKRILAGVAAASVAVSALAVSAFAGSITVNDPSWWTSVDVPLEDLLDGADPADVESITFSSDVKFTVAYNNNTGTDTFVKDNPYWSQHEGVEGSITVDDICLQSFEKPDGEVCDYYLFLAVSLGDSTDHDINWTVKVKDPDVGTTDFSHGGISTQEILVEDPGSVFQNDSGEYQLDVINNPNNVNLLGDAAADVDNAKAVGIRFKVSDFQAGDPTMAVSAIANANTADGNNYHRWNADDVVGVTVKSGDDDVATITGNGEYIVWVVFDGPITYDNQFLVGLVGTLDATAPAAIADDDAVLPYNIEVLSVGVQEADADVTPVEPDEPSEPTPEDPGHEPSDEPTTPGDSTEPDDNSSDDNSSDDNNGNTSVDDGGDNNPGTGVALAVVPAVLAAGALATATIVLKKRK